MCILTISVCQGEDAPNNQTIQKAEIGVIDLNCDVVQCILKDNFLYVLGHDSISKYLITDNDLALQRLICKPEKFIFIYLLFFLVPKG